MIWGPQYDYDRTEGVLQTMVGYTGGKSESPTYEEVCQQANDEGHTRPSAWSLIHRLSPLKPSWSASLPRPRPTSDASSTVPPSGHRASSRPKSRYVWRRGILARATVQCRYSRTARPFTMQKIGTNSTMRSNARLVYAAGYCSARVEIDSVSCAARCTHALGGTPRGWA